ncbi:NAD(P)-dependent oxidoreductase [Nitratireductor indicus]|uniref:NAD(P)-dependent oxidoreductase n=1 Tax=Nitratireductor indicus TaxID=721133 RepID=UPI002876DC97|nr:NAD(P)-dependent oxidoreductase [Nitratireductor indicus]MDS1135140.1 NAD(P)-dependent oxidoreductase [Nitratireductor indicus]
MATGFVGAGKIGLPMALNIARKGKDKLILCDTRPVELPADANVAPERVFITTDLSELAACDVVVLSLPDSKVVSVVIEGRDGKPGLIDILPAGATIIDCSSSIAAETRRLKSRLDAKGILFHDAPVSGGIGRAWTGKLTILAGGIKRDMGKAYEVLGHMGTTIIELDGVGDGHVVKTANNYVLAANIISLLEATAFAVKSGISIDKFEEVINRSSGRSYVSENKLDDIKTEHDRVSFTVGLIRKDVANFIESAEREAISLPMPETIFATWQAAAEALGEDADNMKFFKYLNS